jgi:uncharacterized protein (DUF2147 family)
MRMVFCLIVLATATAAAFGAPEGGVRGDWTTTSNSVVRIGACGGGGAGGSSNNTEHGSTDQKGTDQTVCLSIIKLSPTAPETMDEKNPDASLRKRPLCGLVIGTGFRQADADHLTDGHLYDPKTGHTYRGTITAQNDRLQLHGYIGISMFGRTEVWHRAAATAPCH